MTIRWIALSTFRTTGRCMFSKYSILTNSIIIEQVHQLSYFVRALKNPLANRSMLPETILKRVKYSVGMKGNINIADSVHPTFKVNA